MKKMFLIMGIAFLVLAVVLCYSFVIEHNKMNVTNKIEVTPNKAVENAKNMLGEKNIETITNYDNPAVEKMVFDTPPSMHCFKTKSDVVGKTLYKITFNTTQDGLLGPIVFYVDKSSGDVIGAEYRE